MTDLIKTIIEKERKRFAKIRTDAVSEMLDSPDEYGIFPTTELFRTLDFALDQSIQRTYSLAYQAGVKEGELIGVGKILDGLWNNSLFLMGKLGSDRIKKEMVYYFGKNWMVDMYEFIGAKGKKPEPVKTQKELLAQMTKQK